MADGILGRVRWLAFDVFGTVMDLGGSLSGPVGDFLRAHGSGMSGEAFYADRRTGSASSSTKDNLLMLGHSVDLEPVTNEVRRGLSPMATIATRQAARFCIHGLRRM